MKLLLPLTVSFLGSLASAQHTARLSVFTGGGQVADDSRSPAISATGRHVVFFCADDTLAGGPSNGDIFAHDRDPDGNGIHDEGNGETRVVSVNSSGAKSNNSCDLPALSADGRFVAFITAASNLTGLPDANGAFPDVFVHDRDGNGNGVFDDSNGPTVRVTGAGGAPQPNNFFGSLALSGDGRYVAFSTIANNLVGGDANGQSDVFRIDRTTGALDLVSVKLGGGGTANAGSSEPKLSFDGRYVVFSSSASNLESGVSGDHVYLRDMLAGTTVAVSRSSTGALGNQLSFEPAISADGLVVAFASYASNFDANDSGFDPDIYVRDLVAGTTEFVSVDSFGNQASAPGSVLSHEPSLSSDGSRVAFWSTATNLWWNGTIFTNVFVHDRASGQTRLASQSTSGDSGDANSANFDGLALSGDGTSLAFASFATNLVPSDTNSRDDVFVRELCDDPGFELGHALAGSNGLVPTLEACGELSTGSQVTFTLRHAQPNKLSVIFRSLVLQPHPFKGGTLAVGQPWMRTTIFTDASGSGTFVLPGGGGPADLYVHWLSRDGGLPGHVGFSNALRVPVLP